MTGPDRHTGRPTGRATEPAANTQVEAGVGGGCARESLCLRIDSGPAGARPPGPCSAGPVPSAQADSGRLGPRDLAVLHAVAALRLMTARHVERLVFHTGSPLTRARRSRRTLQRLVERRLLVRLDRRIGGARAGSASYVYRLAPAGRRLLGLTGPHGGRRRTLPQPSERQQDHVLAVAELAVRLHEDHRAGRLELVCFQPEPACWRTYLGPAGERRQLRPDAFVIIATGDLEHLSFVEIDRGTEHLSTIKRKHDAYLRYARSGSEQDTYGTFPKVVYLTTHPGRSDAIRRALHTTPHADQLVAVAEADNPTAALTGGGQHKGETP